MLSLDKRVNAVTCSGSGAENANRVQGVRQSPLMLHPHFRMISKSRSVSGRKRSQRLLFKKVRRSNNPLFTVRHTLSQN